MGHFHMVISILFPLFFINYQLTIKDRDGKIQGPFTSSSFFELF